MKLKLKIDHLIIINVQKNGVQTLKTPTYQHFRFWIELRIY